MQLKVSTDYAICIVLYLAEVKKIVNSKELSAKLGISQNMILKIGNKLNKNDIITLTSGIKGGFMLKKQPEDISLFEIINIFEKTTKISRCLEEDDYCSRFAAEDRLVRKAYCEIQNYIDEQFKLITIKSLI